jgi:AFG3 family protein
MFIIPHLLNVVQLHLMNRFVKRDPNEHGAPQQPPAGKSFKWWWIYLFMLLLILYPSVTKMFSTEREITWQQFERDMLSRKAVDKIIVVNNHL